MSKPVTPQDMFDMWQKMVNPGAYPLQSLMFPVLDPEELEKKVHDLEVVEHWLKANLSMLQLTIKSLQYQRAMLKGGEKFQEEMASSNEANRKAASPAEEAPDNPAMWAWNIMADAAKNANEGMAKGAKAAAAATSKPRSRKKKAPDRSGG
jgi:hypothetical protein